MKPNSKFKKGEFITQHSDTKSFAIYGGDAYEPVKKGDSPDYSLICYYNKDHYEQDSNGKWNRNSVFEYDLEDEETCEYTINENDMEYWRICTKEEVDNALKILAEHRLAWVDEDKKLRILAPNEELRFGERPASTGTPGGNVRNIGHSGPVGNTNPYYAHGTAKTTKLISNKVDENWEQKIPVSTMTIERRELVLNQCEKLRYAFDSYRCNFVDYPRNGSQAPRRQPLYEDELGYGMCAYNQLMREAEWWGYCD